jgi:stage IV sporulation protein FB
LITIPGRIPIIIQPFFWIFASLIGWLNSQSIVGTLIWIGIIVLSVVFHEFGHALSAVFFRQKAQIQLVALGGVTTFEGPKLKFWQQFIIVLNGPLAGICLFFLASICLALPLSLSIRGIVSTIRLVNLFWSIVNLLPVLPLDGGQLLRIALEGFFGVKGFKASLIIGMGFAVLLSFYFFIAQAFLIGAFFFLFAFQTFDLYRKSRNANVMDREDELKKMLVHAENYLEQGNEAEAERLFEEVRIKGGGGLLSAAAAQYLAILLAERGKRREAYELLLENKKHLEDPARCLLHQLGAEHKNHQLVAELAADCYQLVPKQEVALRNARSFAALNQAEPAGGWLQTAWQHGPFDLNAFLQDEVFNSVRYDRAFRHFVDRLYEGHHS